MFSFETIGNIITDYWEYILYGIATTLILAIFGTVVGLILGIFVAYGKNVTIKETDKWPIKTLKYVCKYVCSAYSLIFRGTPMMVQALVIYYLFANLGISWNLILQGSSKIYNVINGNLICGLIVITLNTTAYMCEIVRSGLNGVDFGQVEGARSLGMSSARTSVTIILPQALRNALPTIGNEFIVNIKDSSVLNIIAVADLYYRLAFIYPGQSYRYLESYVLVALIYLVLTLLAAGVLKLVEKKLDGVKFSLNPFRFRRRNTI